MPCLNAQSTEARHRWERWWCALRDLRQVVSHVPWRCLTATVLTSKLCRIGRGVQDFAGSCW